MHSKPGPASAATLSMTRWLLLAYLLFVVYGSLVPLHFVPRSLEAGWQAFMQLPFLQLGVGSRADWVANLLLFIPLTMLAGLALDLRAGRGVRWVAGLLTLVAALALALAIEFTQFFFPQRTMSQNDVWAESLGGLLGVLVHGVWGARIGAWLEGFRLRQSGHSKLRRLLQAYLVLLLVFNVLPLDLTISPLEIYRKWRSGTVVLLPFTMGSRGAAEFVYELLSDALVWLPAGCLWALDGRRSLERVLRPGLAAAAGIELLQLFVYSRVSDVGDIVMAALGLALGWAVGQALLHRPQVWGARLSRHGPALWLAWLLLALALFWFPFDVQPARWSWAATREAFTRLPFTTYYYGTEFHATNELLRKLAVFLPGGLILGFWRSGPGPFRRPLLALLAAAVLVEFGQLLLPGKVADLTDVLLETLGGGLGLLIARWVSAGPVVDADTAVPHRGDAPVPPPFPSTLAPLTPRQHLLLLVALALLLALASRLPGLPYNVRELFRPGWGLAVSAPGLAALVYAIANLPLWLLTEQRRAALLAFPLVLLAHGVLAFGLLWLAVPLESLHDIVGSPVLGWPWVWELLGRFLALYLALLSQLLGAALMVRALLRPQTLADLLYWLALSLLLAWPLHHLVVDLAATDNLTELMAGDAAFWASSALAGALWMSCLTASALAAACCRRSRWRGLLLLAGLAGLAAAGLFWVGTEATIVKYGRVFSAFQFLLSTDRAHYAHGAGLALRYALAYALVCLGLAALQLPSWRRL